MIRSGIGRIGLLLVGNALAVERREIDRVDEQRRETSIANAIGDDLAREREEQARALDHHDGMRRFLRDVLQTEDAGIVQFEIEQEAVAFARFAFKRQLDFVIGR